MKRQKRRADPPASANSMPLLPMNTFKKPRPIIIMRPTSNLLIGKYINIKSAYIYIWPSTVHILQ